MAGTHMDVMHGALDRPVASRPAPKQPPAPESSARSWPQTVLGLVGLGGACLMLYGSAQNSTEGAGPPAFIVGSVIVVGLSVLIVVAAAVHSMRANAADRLGDPRRVQLHCTACDTTLPGGDRGSRETEALAGALKRHEEKAHAPYDPALRKVLELRIALAIAGTLDLPTDVRQYRLSNFSD